MGFLQLLILSLNPKLIQLHHLLGIEYFILHIPLTYK